MIKSVLSIILVSAITFTAAGQDGKEIFQTNCAACHSVGKGKLVGPDLLGVNNKYSEEWLIKWTKSSQSVINSGDAAAVAIFKEFNNIPMTEFPLLSDNEIKSIFQYIQTESDKKTAAATASTDQKTTEKSSSVNNNDFINKYWGISIIALFFLSVLWVLLRVNNMLTKTLKEEFVKNKSLTEQLKFQNQTK